MTLGWKDIAFYLEDALASEVTDAWRWLIGDTGFQPVICSRLGDIFFERKCGRIEWLSCSTGFVVPAADDRIEFDKLCRANGEEVAEWFGPAFIAKLHDSGKIASEGKCYFFITLPVFAECKYEPENIGIVPIREVFVGLADIHRQLASLPDYQKIQVKVVE